MAALSAVSGLPAAFTEAAIRVKPCAPTTLLRTMRPKRLVWS
jgi:hypothetical protein